MERIKVGISSCLLGQSVRYDGSHRHDRYLTDTLGRYFEYVPVCPEVECGLPVPREPMRLVGPPESPRLLTRQTGIDHTARLQAWAVTRVAQLAGAGLCGFIFKAKSPSSGLYHVRCYDAAGHVAGSASGLWARAFTAAFPHLPVEEDGRLHDPDLREHFIERVFTLKRFRDEVAGCPTVAALSGFHTRNKLLLMAHDPDSVAALGRLVAGAGQAGIAALVQSYEAGLMRAMAELATVPRHVNVLQHMQGYLRDIASDDERLEVAEVIALYQRELVPLIVPITLFAHLIRRFRIAYLADQYYLHPHPLELKLRNHA